MRKVRPRVRLISKESTDTAGAKITCLAFGFYPRHINLTLLRDGQPVAEHELKGGNCYRRRLDVPAEKESDNHYPGAERETQLHLHCQSHQYGQQAGCQLGS
nr:uncharacterized protein LOC115102303 isoform X2 [Oncorhynchus nerka]